MRSRYGGAVSLEGFSPAVRAWFESTFETPTAAQAQGWPAIAGGRHSLILAPTGSGKTLAAFLWALDRVMTDPPPPTDQRCRVLYISPLRALAVDIEKNLRTPLTGIGLAAERLGRARARAARRDAHRRHLGERAPPDPDPSARHPDHDAGVALPDAHLPGARDPAQRPLGDRRRDPRDGRFQARRAPRALARAPRGARARASRSASACPRPSDRSRRSRGSSAARPRAARVR